MAARRNEFRVTDETKEQKDKSYPKTALFFGIATLGLAVVGPLLLWLIYGWGDDAAALKLALFFAVPGLTFLGLYRYITMVERAGGFFYKLRPQDWKTLFIQLLPGTALAVLGSLMNPAFGWLSILFGLAISVILTRRPAHPMEGVLVVSNNRLTLREKWLVTGIVITALVAGAFAWAWVSDVVPYEEKWGNYAEWFSGIATALGFAAAIVTIAITRSKYQQEREQFVTVEQSRKAKERETALGVQVDLGLESITRPRGLGALLGVNHGSDLRYVCTITNSTSSSLDNIQIVYPEPHGSDREDWEYTAPIRVFPTQAPGVSVSYREELPTDHPSPAECLALFESMYRVQFTLNGTRWERDKDGLRDLDYSWTVDRN
ncbi:MULTISPECIES: hypothetical protein [unclassified Pseudarthrobacter]|uniref:hypothetical protein n=1 Tax=unclassified Pseudarthrobacter TaxID=2647000 RepID=UPI0030786F11